ncbi:hypothetical protein AAVH_05093 [Aphelenchoides avenae]|nr:hypothetical protein AAVH_05093 [Aphelenchus avenae]
MGRPITEFSGMPPLRDVDWSLENIDMLAEGFEAQDLYELLRDAQCEFVDMIVRFSWKATTQDPDVST